MATKSSSDMRMSIGDHLEELRRRIIYAMIGMAVAAGGMLMIGRSIIHVICRPLFTQMASQDLSPTVHAFSLPEGFTVYLKVSMVTGLAISAPWVLYQGWKFVSAGMYASERHIVSVMLPFSSVMSLVGLAFTYFVMLPIILWFFINFSQQYPRPELTAPVPSNHQVDAASPTQVPVLEQDPAQPASGRMWVKMPEGELRIHIDGQTRRIASTTGTTSMVALSPRLSDYISFVTMVAIGIVVAFQTPVAMFVLGWSGLVDPQWLSGYRRHCVLACFAMGMILTPSDVVSMAVLAMPLWGLYELGLLLMRIVYRRPASA